MYSCNTTIPVQEPSQKEEKQKEEKPKEETTPVTPPVPAPDPEPVEVSLDYFTDNQVVNVFDLTLFHLYYKGQEIWFFPPSELHDYADSLVWTSSSHPGESMKVYHQESSDGYFGCQMKNQWSCVFIRPGMYDTVISYYRDGKVLKCDTVRLEVQNRKDFLMWNWADVNEETQDEWNIGINNPFREDNKGEFTYRRTYLDNTPGIVLQSSCIYTDRATEDKKIDQLYEYISEFYGKPKFDKGDKEVNEYYTKSFGHQREGVSPICIWVTEKNKIALLRLVEDNIEYSSEVWIYAEPANK